jgi:hypothetical protein
MAFQLDLPTARGEERLASPWSQEAHVAQDELGQH